MTVNSFRKKIMKSHYYFLPKYLICVSVMHSKQEISFFFISDLGFMALQDYFTYFESS